ncbi:MAG: hypothetical protein IPN86_23270 [Saprospiraceae bacterium]|nr:hypothetical protein [Saprospiraceae bacterium]
MNYHIFSLVLFLNVSLGFSQFNCDPKCYSQKQFNNTANSSTKFAAYQWQVDNVLMFQTPLVMDIFNNDGIPEVLIGKPTTNNNPILSNGIIIIDTKSKSVVKTINTAYYRIGGVGSYVIADVNNDCKMEIIMAASEDKTFAALGQANPDSLLSKLICYDLDGNILWISDEKVGKYLNPLNKRIGGTLGLADFNQDGIAEVYIYNEIFNAVNGKKLVDGGNNGLGEGNSSGGGGAMSSTIAANLNDNTMLELAAGYTVYSVNITNSNSQAGNSMSPINIDIGRFADGFTAVADMDMNGQLEIIVSGAGYLNPNDGTGRGVYCYTVQNNQAIFICSSERIPFGTGPALVCKKNKNSPMDVLAIRNGNIKDSILSLKILNNDTLIKNWNYPIDENSGRVTNITMFDLDGDGYGELIYRDEQIFRIFDLRSNYPQLLFSYPCNSGTSAEMPIVADIDGSGQAKICVTCAENMNDQNGRLIIFGPPPGQRWTPARKIWHQYAYNPLFINDDGTVPQYMHNPATYKNGKYNNFMVQESLIDEYGNYPVPAASLTGSVSCIAFDINTQQYTVDFSVNNRADASATAISGVPVAFYNGNPESGGSLIDVYRTNTDITAGNTLSGLSYSFSTNDLTSLYMIVNTDKYPIIVSDTSYYDIDECDYTDNIFIAPAPTFTEVSQEICQGYSYTFYGDALTSSGTYYHELAGVTGCDSVIARLDLQVNHIKTESLTTSACDTYVWNGQTYTTDGAYTYKTLSVNGCDSITTLNLSVFRSVQINQSIQSCDTYAWNGQIYTQSGVYSFRTQNIHGCDSIVSLDLKVYPSADITQTHAACDAYIWNGQTYTQSGTYTYQTQTKNGCDSTITLDLTFSTILRTNHPITACDTYTWNGITYDADGDYTFTAQSIQGCDSINLRSKRYFHLSYTKCLWL